MVYSCANFSVCAPGAGSHLNTLYPLGRPTGRLKKALTALFNHGSECVPAVWNDEG